MTDTVTIQSPGMGLDLREFQRFARALRKAQPELALGLRVKLRAAGEIVAGITRSNFAAASTSVPPSVKVRVSSATIAVVAGGPGVPMAGLLEMGNKGGRGADTFRHPVFGNRAAWVDQPMHPSLGPAVEQGSEAVYEAAIDALDEAVKIAVSE